MKLILTMAGKYTRFKEFSYQIPKYLLPVSNRTILHYVLKSFVQTGVFEEVLLVANKRDIRFRPQITDTAAEFNIPSKNIVFIDDTLGQASTALVGIHHLDFSLETPVVFHNIDTILYDRDFGKIKEMFSSNQSSCVIDVFNSHHKDYSYVLVNQGKVELILEKKVVSNIASSGCYCFSSGLLIAKFLTQTIAEGKYYISDTIQRMIEEGLRVSISPIKTEEQTIVLGTPEEYIASITNIRKK